jgi:HlyD family secretion protein
MDLFKNQFAKKIVITLLLLLHLFGCGSSEDLYQGYIEGKYVYVSSAVSGQLIKNMVKRGDDVKKGQQLFALDQEPELSKLDQAQFNLDQAKQELINLKKGARHTVEENIKAKLKQAKSGLVFARKTYERYKTLYKTAAIGKATLDRSSKDYEQSLQKVKEIKAQLAESKLGARENLIKAQEAIVKSAKAQVKQAKWALMQKSMISPADSHVFDLIYAPGEFIQGGLPVVILLSPKDTYVIFFIGEQKLNSIKTGDKIFIDCDGCKKRYQARIDYIYPNAEYTPPVIFSQESRDKLVYRVEAKMSIEDTKQFNTGQPVSVMVSKSKN